MKVTLHHALFIPFDVELPDKCPKCGADFVTQYQSALRQWTYELHGWHAHIDKDEEEVIDDNPYKGDWETTFSLGLRCECGHIIAEGRIEEIDILGGEHSSIANPVSLPDKKE